MGSVIGDADIEVAWPRWSTDDTRPRTTWTCWVVTRKALGYVRVQYDKAYYDRREEHRQMLTPSNQSAWVRPLSRLVELRWGAIYEAESQHDTYYPAEPITATFTDGEITIPEGDLLFGDRGAADRILTALRKGANDV